MARIIVTMTYDVRPRRRKEFLTWLRRVRTHIRRRYKGDYSFYEDRDLPNRFTELFICPSAREYRRLADLHDVRLDRYIWEMDRFVGDREQARFHTLAEVR